MKCTYLIKHCCLHFSGWSKKGYAIFCSLGHEIHISRLALHMYETVLLKSSSSGILINLDTVTEEEREPMVLADIQPVVTYSRGEVCPLVQAGRLIDNRGYIAIR